MTQQGKQIKVQATVKGKSEEEQGWKIELDIPSFNSKYPTMVNRVDAELAQSLSLGRNYSLTLELQNLKRGKDGKPERDQTGRAQGLPFSIDDQRWRNRVLNAVDQARIKKPDKTIKIRFYENAQDQRRVSAEFKAPRFHGPTIKKREHRLIPSGSRSFSSDRCGGRRVIRSASHIRTDRLGVL
ncbi:MAG: hypothetical protein IIC02_05880 [Planctomycetes bacterium]|nr:hypothetical protein [Planctomycetota bacterium]